MRNFNKYEFLRELKNEIELAIENREVNDQDEIQSIIDSNIENACIYYADCFAIAMELNATDFDCFDAPINNISQLAFYALSEYVNEELDINELIELVDAKQIED